MLKYPTYPKFEYECVHESLYIVDYQLELERLEQELKTLDAEYNKTYQPPQLTDDSIQGAILDAFKEPAESRSEESQARCRALLDAYAVAMNRDGVARDVKLRPVLEKIRQAYQVFDVARFEADAAAVFREVDNSECLAKALKYYADRDALTEKIAEHKLTLPKCFKNDQLPDRFRDRIVAKLSDDRHHSPQAVEQFEKRRQELMTTLGSFIAKSFVDDWRQRAPQFPVPVTPAGNSIDAVRPIVRKRRWQRAYAKLKLGFLEKKLRYAPVYPEGRPPVREVEPGGPLFDNAKAAVASA